MINVAECVVCGTAIRKVERGLVAPFLAERIWGREAFAAEYLHCDQCDFGFFNPRLEPAEEVRLYAGYRDEEYLRIRHSTEPWYTAKLNNSFDDTETMNARRRKLQEIFNRELPPSGPASVLDFGGDRGELIHSLFPAAEKFVYDISNVDPLPGIKSLSLRESESVKFELIICSNVLEHVASPKRLLSEIESIAVPGTLIFLEVPVETPRNWRTIAKRLAQEGILLGTRPSLAVSLLKLRSINVMHEHLNFFSLRSLQRLASSIKRWKLASSGQYAPFVRTASPTAWVMLRSC
jgi:SAM-dependent methyltransferase